MSDIQERPFKIRKLELIEEPNDFPQQNSPNGQLNLKKDPAHTTNDPVSEDEENDISNIDTQEQTEDPPQPSKSQLKKLRKQEQWEAGKELRKAKRREKHKEKQARKAKQRATIQQKIASGDIDVSEAPAGDAKKRPRRPVQIPVTLIIDCDFDELMTEKELISLGAQLTRCYSDNRTSPYRTHMVISSWNGKLRSRFESVLANNHLGWKGVRFTEKDFVSAAEELNGVMKAPGGGKLAGALSVKEGVVLEAEKTGNLPTNPLGSTRSVITDQSLTVTEATAMLAATSAPIPSISEAQSQEQSNAPDTTATYPGPVIPSVVYLTSDSPCTLDKLSPNTTYIIGGIVDKNRHKSICYKRACARGIPTAKLPIGEYMTMQSRSVLAVNHVVEIMLKWLETGDWGEAFLSVIPKRKEAKLRVQQEIGTENAGEEDSEDGEEDSGTNLEEETYGEGVK